MFTLTACRKIFKSLFVRLTDSSIYAIAAHSVKKMNEKINKYLKLSMKKKEQFLFFIFLVQIDLTAFFKGLTCCFTFTI